MNFEIPILIITFNRSDLFNLQIDILRKVQPKILIISIDGPRLNNNVDKFEHDNIVYNLKNIDWNCDLLLIKREINLGCKRNMIESITEAFSKHSELIILEDDVIPDLDFFNYMNKMMTKFRNSHDVFLISGYTSIQEKLTEFKYRRSRVPEVWGWGTWKRSWEKYEPNPKNSHIFKIISHEAMQSLSFLYFILLGIRILLAKYRLIDTWDYQLYFSLLRTSSNTIIPTNSLVENLGFDGRGTHTNYFKISQFKRINRVISSEIQEIPYALEFEKRIHYRENAIFLQSLKLFFLRILGQGKDKNARN